MGQRLSIALFLFILLFSNHSQAVDLGMQRALMAAGGACYALNSQWAPAWSNLKGYWKLDGSGSIANGATITATAGTNGTAVITGGSATSYASARIDQGIDLDGSDEYVSVANTAALKPSLPVSMAAWFRIDDYATKRRTLFVTDRWTDTTFNGIHLEVTTSGKIQVHYGTGGGSGSSRRSMLGSTVLTTGRWYHIVAVLQGATNMQLYLNGVAETGTAGGSASGSISYTTNASTIGWSAGFANDNQTWDGVIDELAFWDAALSAQQAKMLYDQQSCGKN